MYEPTIMNNLILGHLTVKKENQNEIKINTLITTPWYYMLFFSFILFLELRHFLQLLYKLEKFFTKLEQRKNEVYFILFF